MEQKQDKALFPGQRKGLIRVFIKRGVPSVCGNT